MKPSHLLVALALGGLGCCAWAQIVEHQMPPARGEAQSLAVADRDGAERAHRAHVRHVHRLVHLDPSGPRRRHRDERTAITLDRELEIAGRGPPGHRGEPDRRRRPGRGRRTRAAASGEGKQRGRDRDKSFHARRLERLRFLSQQKRLLYRLS